MADYASVERSITDQKAVLCALGASTPLRRDPTLIVGVRNIIRAMEQAGVWRGQAAAWYRANAHS